MEELIVLGLIPGTTVEITFAMWAMIVGTLTARVFYSTLKRRHILIALWISLTLTIQIRRLQA